MVRYVGLTGGIGAGKSTALSALERLGVAVLSTDAVVRELYDTQEIRAMMRERFGAEVAPGGEVDRNTLAERVFASEGDRVWLEGVLWPRVGTRMAAWRESLQRLSPRPRVAVVEVPLLFESGLEGTFDATIAIVADEAVRRQRASSRQHRSLDERTARQLTQQEKAARATYVVHNDSTVDELERQLSAVLEKL